MSAHTRTWNLKAALGPKPCKVNQQYRHTNVNQQVLAEEVPKNTNKDQIPSLRSQLSNHVKSVASPQYKHQLKCAWRRSSLISAFFKFISNQGQAQFAAQGAPESGPKYLYTKKLFIYDSHSFCINRTQASNTWHLLLFHHVTS